MKNVLIVGTGALGTLFAGRLALAGASVTVLGTWEAALNNLNLNGAQLLQPDGSTLQVPVRATNDPRDCENPDLALVLVKAWQTGRAAHQLADCLPGQAVAVTLQNGLGNRELLQSSLGMERVIQGVTSTGATLIGAGLVRAGGEGLISLETHAISPEVAELLRKARFKVEIDPDVQALLWGKLVINTAINPLTALLRVPNGALLERAGTRQMLAALASETAAVALALGIRLPFDDPVAAAEEVARRTAVNHSSMLQDASRGAQTEIDAISGAVVLAGQRAGVPVPINWSMWQLLRS